MIALVSKQLSEGFNRWKCEWRNEAEFEARDAFKKTKEMLEIANKTTAKMSAIKLMKNALEKIVQMQLRRGERVKRASLDEDEHTRDESREMASDIIMATSTTKLQLFHSINF